MIFCSSICATACLAMSSPFVWSDVECDGFSFMEHELQDESVYDPVYAWAVDVNLQGTATERLESFVRLSPHFHRGM